MMIRSGQIKRHKNHIMNSDLARVKVVADSIRSDQEGIIQRVEAKERSRYETNRELIPELAVHAL